MGVIATDKNKATLFYHPDTELGRRMNAYVSSSDMPALTIDLSQTKVTGTQWADIASKLNKEIPDLIETQHPDFVKHYGEDPVDMDEHDWLKVIENHPELIIHPILIKGNTYIQIEKLTDFTDNPEIMGHDSAGIKRSPAEEEASEEE